MFNGQGNVVEDFYIGNTRIRICDDSCRNKTPEDVNTIMKHIAKRALEAFNRSNAES
jgi:hypothetical protein